MESSMRYYQQKKVAMKLRCLGPPVGMRVRANRRVGVNDLDIDMNDQGVKTTRETPFLFLELPGGKSSCAFLSGCG
jgi:hypothetical protein